MEGKNFAIAGKNIYPGYGSAFLDAILLPKLPSADLQNASSTLTLSHSIGFDQKTHFTANKIQQWAHDHGIRWSYNVSPPFQSNQLDRKMKWPFEDSFIAPAMCQHLTGTEQRRLYLFSNQHLIYGAFLP